MNPDCFQSQSKLKSVYTSLCMMNQLDDQPINMSSNGGIYSKENIFV